MRWTLVILVVAGCSQHVPRKPYRPAPPLSVEQVAAWFMRAALAGDDARARQLSVDAYTIATYVKEADAAEWDATLKTTLEQLAAEGDGERHAVDATVVELRTLDPARDDKLLRPVEVAVVQLRVDGRASPSPWFFMKTDAGWKFSPKK